MFFVRFNCPPNLQCGEESKNLSLKVLCYTQEGTPGVTFTIREGNWAPRRRRFSTSTPSQHPLRRTRGILFTKDCEMDTNAASMFTTLYHIQTLQQPHSDLIDDAHLMITRNPGSYQ